MKDSLLRFLVVVVFWLCGLGPVTSGSADEEKKVVFAEEDRRSLWEDVIGYRATVDISGMGLYSDEKGDLANVFAIGFDANAKISRWNRDLATIIVQLYGVRLENHPAPPPFFEGEDDWEFTPRICNVNFHLSGDGRFNIKAGHYEMPYGLEATINSNGTLRQFTHPSNLGTKVDWGVTANGTFPKFQYEIGLSRGSGMEFESRGNPYAVAGRIGTPIDTENFWGTTSYGLSFYQADLLLRNGTLMDRWRVGLDGQHYIGPFGGLGEISFGETAGEATINMLTELNVSNPKETLLTYSQFRWVNQKRAMAWDDSGSIVFGVRYAPDNHWALSAQFTQ